MFLIRNLYYSRPGHDLFLYLFINRSQDVCIQCYTAWTYDYGSSETFVITYVVYIQLKVILFSNLKFYRRGSNLQISINILVNCCSMEV